MPGCPAGGDPAARWKSQAVTRSSLTYSGVVMAGGVVGTLARAGVATALAPAAGSWPWSTFLVNLLGAALLGWLSAATGDASMARALVGTGFCGALTTFSTFQLETARLFDAHHTGLAVAYWLASVVCGLAAARAGRSLA